MARKTRDMRVPANASLAAFLLELSSCRACLRRLAQTARQLPEGDEYHDARDQVGTLLNRVTVLEQQAATWRPST